ncbi:uncharacterized protein LOC141850426 [Brevipalpus obovatus]|uniref:uncharacterized protein LOC141850426 n=1 Tax=Brevipalpus obovatus TaxID=246614 RepID=UPI003D9F10CF
MIQCRDHWSQNLITTVSTIFCVKKIIELMTASLEILDISGKQTVSAADTYIGVCVSFDAIIREIFLKRSGRASQPQCNSNSTSHKKLSIVTVSKVFGAVFGRNSSDGNFYYPDMSCSSIDMSNCSDNSKTRRSPSSLGSRSFCKAKKSKSATMIRVTRKQSQPILSV